jgi:5'-nucleotidase
MKTLLLTNDDGYLSEGIQRLKDYLSSRYDVYMAAPDRERSAISMSLTINHPLRLNRISEKEFIVDGTPSDCINIALQKLMPQPPDFIISGMNEGENLCEDVFFSGTVAGAFIGHMYGIPAMAVSLIEDKKKKTFNFEEGARIAGQVLEKLLPLKNTNVVYNLNIPPHNNGKIVVTSLGLKRYKPSIVERTDPRGRDYYWIGTGNPTSDGEQGTDLQAIKGGNIVLSVLKYDLNDSKELKKLSELFNEKNIS